MDERGRVRGLRVGWQNHQQHFGAAVNDPVVVETPWGGLDAIALCPPDAVAAVLLAHGAGAGMDHRNMAGIATAMATNGLATLRFNFPFMQLGRRRVDAPATAMGSIARAAQVCAATFDLPLFLGGHSFGGRMSTRAVAETGIACRGLVLCSFPLHAAKKPSVTRAEHLQHIEQPMLFLSGTRDDLAEAELLRGVVERLPRATLHWLDTANHSYAVLKRKRVDPRTVFEEIGQVAREFVDGVL